MGNTNSYRHLHHSVIGKCCISSIFSTQILSLFIASIASNISTAWPCWMRHLCLIVCYHWLWFVICCSFSVHATSIACLSILEAGSLLCGSFWGFFHCFSFPVERVFFFHQHGTFFLTWIEGLRTEDVVKMALCQITDLLPVITKWLCQGFVSQLPVSLWLMIHRKYLLFPCDKQHGKYEATEQKKLVTLRSNKSQQHNWT